jgi:hypothetical protein
MSDPVDVEIRRLWTTMISLLIEVQMSPDYARFVAEKLKEISELIQCCAIGASEET